MNKWLLFLKTARLLNDMGVVPLLYGSLGLSVCMDAPLPADDIDMLVPEVWLADKWFEFRAMLESHRYTLADAHEHSFEKKGVAHSFASLEELESFAGIGIADIEVRKTGNARYLLLNLEQYLRVYRASAKDGYRIAVRKKKDNEKIALIELLLAEKAAGDKRLQLVYDALKDTYPLVLTNTFALEDGFTEDMPVIVGRNRNRSFWLYDYDDFVFSVEVPGQQYHDHWHPWNVKAAIDDVIEFMEEQP